MLHGDERHCPCQESGFVHPSPQPARHADNGSSSDNGLLQLSETKPRASPSTRGEALKLIETKHIIAHTCTPWHSDDLTVRLRTL
eukprot:6174172-Pleurochrysis_carterae.AAC.3